MKNKHNKKRRVQNFIKNKEEGLRGRLLITSHGFGIFKNTEFPEGIKINQSDLNTAFNGDIVEIFIKPKRQGEREKGVVKKIIKRAKKQIVGTIKKENGIVSFIPDDTKFYKTLTIIHNSELEKAKIDDKVVIELEPWDDPQKNPAGIISKILGKKGLHEVEMEAILYEKGFTPNFSKEIETEAQKIKDQAPADFEEEVKKRISRKEGPPSSWDFRKTTTFTIDPFDAKDFDDALSFKELENGNYEIGIHIADVTHYVKEGSILDKEAVHRGTSVYLVDRTIPMLPEVLSNNLCSLNPNEDKLAFSVIFLIDKNTGKTTNSWIGETIINSDKRFSYIEAQKSLETIDAPFSKELNKLNDIAFKEHSVRTKNGSIAFGNTEMKFKLDEKGFPIEIYLKESLEVNDLIEDFMLLANKRVAEYAHELSQKSGAEKPFVYRIHDEPKKENILGLAEFLKKVGYKLNNNEGSVASKDINHLLDVIQGADEEDLIEKAVLKSMSKAVYSTHNIGHYGLSFNYYTHFTSPIRRYPDMMVHRLVKRYLNGEDVSIKEIPRLEELCAGASRSEVLAVEAERDSDKYKYAQYMSQRIGQEFNVVISGIANWGIYVQEESTKAEGLIGLRSLKGDFYDIDHKNYRIIGQKTKKTYTLGDKLKVKLTKVNIEKRTLDFEIIK